MYNSERKPLQIQNRSLSEAFFPPQFHSLKVENSKADLEQKENFNILEKKLLEQQQLNNQLKSEHDSLLEQNRHYQKNYTILEQNYKEILNEKELEIAKLKSQIFKLEKQSEASIHKFQKTIQQLEEELSGSKQVQEQMNEELMHAKQVVDKAEQKLNYFYSKIKEKENDLRLQEQDLLMKQEYIQRQLNTIQTRQKSLVNQSCQTDETIDNSISRMSRILSQENKSSIFCELENLGQTLNEKLWERKIQVDIDQISKQKQHLEDREKNIKIQEEKLMKFYEKLKKQFNIELF